MANLAEEFGIDIDNLHPAIKADIDKLRRRADAYRGYRERYREFSEMITKLDISSEYEGLAERVARTAAQASSLITRESFPNFLIAAIEDLPANATRKKVQSFRARYTDIADYIADAA